MKNYVGWMLCFFFFTACSGPERRFYGDELEADVDSGAALADSETRPDSKAFGGDALGVADSGTDSGLAVDSGFAVDTAVLGDTVGDTGVLGDAAVLGDTAGVPVDFSTWTYSGEAFRPEVGSDGVFCSVSVGSSGNFKVVGPVAPPGTKVLNLQYKLVGTVRSATLWACLGDSPGYLWTSITVTDWRNVSLTVNGTSGAVLIAGIVNADSVGVRVCLRGLVL